jgi:hypothetical protein
VLQRRDAPLHGMVVSLQRAGKYQKPTWQLSKGQKWGLSQIFM